MSTRPSFCSSAVALVALAEVFSVAGAARASNQLLEVPVRWCAIQGSPAAANPGGVGEPDTDNALWRRHERASDRVWLNQNTGITFRSAFTADILAGSRSFPVIADPSASPGMPGDILDPNTGNKTEYEAAKQACKAAWDALASQSSLLGPIALNVRKLVKADGSENLQGYGEYSYVGAANVCANPPTGIQTAAGALAIADYSVVRGFDPDETILAHEFGHTLALEHGNGLDDNGNSVFDGYGSGGGCDTGENQTATPSSLMTPGVNAKLITGLQKGKARVFALKYSGTQIDPPAALIPGDTIGDEHVDSIYEVSDRSIDITSVIVSTHTPSQTTIFTHELIDLLPEVPQHQFLVFADLDFDATTGGAPDDLNLGVPTAFEGAEIATRVVIVYGPEGFEVTPTLWRFQGGSWVEISDSSIQAGWDSAFGGEVPLPQYDVVSIRFSDAVRGAMAPAIRVQAFAQAPAPVPGMLSVLNGDPAPFDRAPDFPLNFIGLQLTQPSFPVAVVTPFVVRPGQAVLVEAIGLFPNLMAKIFFGDSMVGVGNSDGVGAVTQSFVVPFDAALGERLVTVGSVGTGLTADTTAVVEGLPLTPTPVAIDVKPNSCPNAFNVKKGGVLPVAILGSATLDVSQLDPTLVRLEGVAPLASIAVEIEDVATPFLPITGRRRAKDCTTAGPDGFADLVLHFDAKAVAATLGAVVNKQARVLDLTGNFDPALGGAPISGEDVIVTLTK